MLIKQTLKTMRKKLILRVRSGVRRLNLTKRVCDNLLGKEHALNHRMVVGAGFVIVGVFIAKLGPDSFAIVFEGFGYIIHGIGTVPFVEKAISLMQVVDVPAVVDEVKEVVEDEVEA